MFEDVEGGCFSFEVWVDGKYELTDGLFTRSYSSDERSDLEIFESFSVDRGEASTEDMVVSAIRSAPLDGEHVEILFYDHEETLVTTRIATDTAFRCICVHISMARGAEHQIASEISYRP